MIYSVAYPVVQFVSAPDPDADVRLDLNSDFGLAKCSLNADGFSLGAPVLNGEPGSVGGSWGYRGLTLVPRITGPKAAALDLLSLLAREQMRATNWLHIRLDALTPSRWIQTYKSPPQALSLDEVDVEGRNPDAWQTELTLTADPFALCERITLGPYTVTQSPDGDHPMGVVLPAIEGDAATALRVEITCPGAVLPAAQWLVGCVSGETTMTDPVVELGTGDIFTDSDPSNGVDVTDADYFGGSYYEMTIPAGQGLISRLTAGSFPALPTGVYKVLLRVEVDGDQPSGREFLFGLEQDASGVVSPAVPVSGLPTSALPWVNQFWVDLGDFTFPRGVPPLPADTEVVTLASGLKLHVGLSDAAEGVLNLDVIKLIPVGGPTVSSANMLLFDGHRSTGAATVVDGDDEVRWSYLPSNGHLLNDEGALHGGRFPVADPAAAQNLLVVMAMLCTWESATSNATEVGTDVEVTVSYHPRKLHL